MNPNSIQIKQGQELADEYQIKFIETSAKDGTNIDKAFRSLLKEIIPKIDKLTEEEILRKTQGQG